MVPTIICRKFAGDYLVNERQLPVRHSGGGRNGREVFRLRFAFGPLKDGITWLYMPDEISIDSTGSRISCIADLDFMPSSP